MKHKAKENAQSAVAFGLTICVGLFALCIAAEAQPPNKVPRIGLLALASRSSISPRVEAFQQGLRELGYV